MQTDKPKTVLLLSRKMQQDGSDLSIQTGLFGSMFYIKLLPAFTATQMSSLQPTQWERRRAPSQKDRLALCLQLQSVYYNITIRKAHWNSSIHHPPHPGNRVITSTKQRSRAKVNWALCTTPEHLSRKDFGNYRVLHWENTASTDLKNCS